MVLVAGNISLASKIILVPTLSFTFIYGTIGNILVCMAILKNHNMKTATNGFILSLAVADLAVCAITVPFALLCLFQDPRPEAALLVGEVAMSAVSCSLLQLAIISVDRYRGIVHPEKSRLQWHHVKYIIPPLWLIAIAETCIVVFNWKRNIWFALIHFVWFWFIAITAMLCYGLIWRRIVQHNKAVGNSLARNKDERMRNERKSIKMIMLVLGCLVLCWAPTTIVYGIFIISYKSNPVLSDSMRQPLNVLVAFGYFNSCINPLIYAIMNTSFRKAFHQILASNCLCRGVGKVFIFQTSSHSTSSLKTTKVTPASFASNKTVSSFTVENSLKIKTDDSLAVVAT